MTQVDEPSRLRRRPYPVSAAAATVWAFCAWLLLTWTATAEQLAFGAALAIAVGTTMSALGDVIRPWLAFSPRRAVALVRLVAVTAAMMVRANLRLARRIWAPSRPLASGMIIVPTRLRSDVGLATTALVTSLIVDNQIVDLDRGRARLQYHTIAVPAGDEQERPEAINAPTERLIARVERSAPTDA